METNKKILNLLIFTLILCVMITLPLWVNERSLVVVPVFDSLLFSNWIQIPLLIIWGFLALGMFILRLDKRVVLFAFLVLSLLFALQDQLRWQPWFYQIEIMLLFYFFYFLKLIDEIELLDVFRLLVVGIYTWSGIHKFNAAFVEVTMPNLLFMDVGLAGYIIPITETFLALGLIWRFTRIYSVVGLLCMHIFILISTLFGGMAHNLVILPWNIMMMVLLYILFYKEELKKPFTSGDISLAKLFIILLFWILPASNFIGYWDSYPSFTFYTGKVDKGFIYVSEDFKRNFSKVSAESFDDQNKLYLQKWSFLEHKVPIYPERRVYKRIFKNLCSSSKHELDVILEIEYLPHILNNKWEKESYFCDEITDENKKST